MPWAGKPGAVFYFNVVVVDIKLINVDISDMKKEKSTRPYHMTRRARQAAATEKKIFAAAFSLWKELPYHKITLEKVADRAGVAVRTILRKYGSKDGLIEACLENDVGVDSRAVREKAPVGDLQGILVVLLADYEEIGAASLNMLRIEEEHPVAKKMLETARSYHREWCARVFLPYLPLPDDEGYERKLLSLVAATEFYLWKLLRIDLGKTYAETYAVFATNLQALIDSFTK